MTGKGSRPGSRRRRPPRRSWSRAQMREAFRRSAAALGRAPNTLDWQHASVEHPATGTVIREYGSFTAGVRDAGLEPTPQRRRGPSPRWTQAAIVASLRAFNRKHRRPPSAHEWMTGADDHPPTATVQRRFGSWNAALEAAGLPVRPAFWSNEMIIEAIRAYHDEHGRGPTYAAWRRRADGRPGSDIVVARFGSMHAARAAAGAAAPE